MQDIKLPKNNLEAFEMWRDSWKADLISMLSSSKKIPVRFSIPVVDESETTVLDQSNQYSGGVYKKVLPKRVVKLTPRVELTGFGLQGEI